LFFLGLCGKMLRSQVMKVLRHTHDTSMLDPQ